MEISNYLKLKENDEPKTSEETMEMRNRRKWIKALEKANEIKSMRECQAWKLVECSEYKRIVYCEWVYIIKSDSINTYEGDYDQVFAPVVKQATIRALLTMSGLENEIVKHLVLKTVYSNRASQGTVYMCQPKGFEDKDDSQLVCQSKKSIYGLKHSARVWNGKITGVLMNDGFRRGFADTCLFPNEISDRLIHLLLYVDDIILAADFEKDIQEVEKLLGDNFEMKMFENLKYYLGIEVEKQKNGIFHPYEKTTLKKS
ncbi:hypothetical protein JTB14_018310 [Gonioctena quinquepunctata]|nr:hypothetical protein JTB14_018310 [Gonioctena quinquepunctata]